MMIAHLAVVKARESVIRAEGFKIRACLCCCKGLFKIAPRNDAPDNHRNTELERKNTCRKRCKEAWTPSVEAWTLLVVVPFTAACVTLSMSLINGAKYAFVSDALNFEKKESMALWSIRYLIWHLAFGGIVYFKYRLFPKPLQWLAILNLVVFLLVLWSGFKQIDGDGYFGSWRQYSHWIMAGVVFFLFAVETPIVWWPHQNIAIASSVVVVVYIILFLCAEYGIFPDSGIPKIREHYTTIALEWLMMIAHLAVVKARESVIRAEGFKIRACLCCCKGLFKIAPKDDDDTHNTSKADDQMGA
jgi:hypothetical protein